MELRELNQQGPIQMNGPNLVSPNGFNLTNNHHHGHHHQQHQHLLTNNIHNQVQNRYEHSLQPAHPIRSNIGQATQIRYNGTNNTNTNHKSHTTKQHRELPVDVPDSFVGVAKQSPRYPPPKPLRQISPPMPLNQFNTFNYNTTPTATPTAQPTMSSTTTSTTATTTTINNHSNHNNHMNYQSHHNNRNVGSNQQQQQTNTVPAIAQSAATSIMNHNSSLRTSIKLKNLEKSKNNPNMPYAPAHQMQPAINQAFELNEDDDGQPVHQNLSPSNINQIEFDDHNRQLKSLTNNHHIQQVPQQHQQQSSSLASTSSNNSDLTSLYNRLQNNLNGEFSDVAVDGKLAKLLSIYNTLIKTHDRKLRIAVLSSKYHSIPSNGQTTTNIHPNQTQLHGQPVVFKLTELLYSVTQILRVEQNMTDDISELLTILYKHELDGVCSAFDRISQSFEFAKSDSPPPASPQNTLRMDDKSFQEQQFQNHNNTSLISTNHNQANLVNNQVNHVHTNQMNGIDRGHLAYNGNHNSYINDYHHNDRFGDSVQMDIGETMFHHGGMHPMTEVDLNEDGCTRTVHIDKSSNQPLGATIKNDGSRVIVGRIVCAGLAHKSGLLNEGDEILEVNGIPIRGKNINEVVSIMESLNGTLSLTIMMANYKPEPLLAKLREKTFVRAFFDFEGETDEFIPCKELGLSFKKGEILSIIDQSDQIWWQANREHDSDSRLAGLIPSVMHLKQRNNHLSSHDLVPNYHSMKHEKKNFVSKLLQCPKVPTHHHHGGIHGGRRSKKDLMSTPFGPDQITYYEEVSPYYPIKYKKRPIILVGPKIGQRELVAKLLQDSSRFADAISHTSRPRQDHERNGVDFHFVTRAQFEADMKAGKFIESGQYQNQYYGTTLDAMREVVRSKKICVHSVNTPSIFNFRHGRAGSELRPYFVFYKPDDSHPDKLRNMVASYSLPKTNIEETMRAIVAEVQLIEAHYLPYFDLVLTVSNVDRAYQELLVEIDKIERDPQWIPSFWQESPSK